MKIGPDTVQAEIGRAKAVQFSYTPASSETPLTWGAVRAGEAVGVLAVTPERKIVLTQQPRPVIRHDAYLELPAGMVDAGERPPATAARELQEETGYVARGWVYLGPIYPSPGVLDEKIYLFLALNLIPGPTQPDPHERITMREVDSQELDAMIAAGRITDAKLIAALTLVRCKNILL